MTYDEMMSKILAVFPDALIEEVDGEILIATGMTASADGNVYPVEEEEF